MFTLSRGIPAIPTAGAPPPPGDGNVMGTISRQVVIGAFAALGLTYAGLTVSAHGSPTSALGLHGSRIRMDNPVLRTLVRDASERSQTFRELVAAIDATDGLVYIRVGT